MKNIRKKTIVAYVFIFLFTTVFGNINGIYAQGDDGLNVNNKVEVTKLAFDSFDGGNRVEPNNGGGFTFAIDFNFDDSIKKGDFFTVKYSDNISITGVLENVYPLSLIDGKGNVIAVGTFNEDTNTSKYIFTDYMDNHSKVKASLNAGALVNMKVIKNDKTNVEFSIAAAEKVKTITKDVYYGQYYETRGNATIGSSIISNNDITEEITYVTYVNVAKEKIDNSQVYIYADSKNNSMIGQYSFIDGSLKGINPYSYSGESGTKINANDSTFKVYKVPSGTVLPKNFVISDDEYAGFEEISIKPTYNSKDGVKYAKFDFTNYLNEGETYVIKLVTKAENRDIISAGSEMVAKAKNSTYNMVGTYSEIYGYTGWSNGDGINTTSLRVIKTDENGNYLKGSTFRLYSETEDVSGKPIYNEIFNDAKTSNTNLLFFSNLKEGKYFLKEVYPPKGFEKLNDVKTVEVKNESGSLGVYVDGVKAENHEVKIENKRKSVQIGNYVWIDENKDGIQDDGEKPVSGVKVDLYKADEDGNKIGEIIESTITNEKGIYNFKVNQNSKYVVEFTVPEGYQVTTSDSGGDLKDSDGKVISVTTKMEDDFSYDLGIYQIPHTPVPEPNPNPVPQPATTENHIKIGDYVWMDTNENGIQDENEKPVKDVLVNLYDVDIYGNLLGKPIDSIKTDKNGKYEFKVEKNRRYVIEFIRPEGYTVTTTKGGDDREKDSDGLYVKVMTANEDDFSYDLGIYKDVNKNVEDKDDNNIKEEPIKKQPTKKEKTKRNKEAAVSKSKVRESIDEPYTGDDSGIFLVVVGIMGSIIALIALVVLKKRNVK